MYRVVKYDRNSEGYMGPSSFQIVVVSEKSSKTMKGPSIRNSDPNRPFIVLEDYGSLPIQNTYVKAVYP